jgi:hypothetical protein
MLFLPVSGASVIGGRELLFRHSAAARAREDLPGEARCLDVDRSVQRVVTNYRRVSQPADNPMVIRLIGPFLSMVRKPVGKMNPNFLYRSVQSQIGDVKEISIPTDKKS